jgi:putative hemolysin
LDTNDSWETIKFKINSEKHSAYPVCENNDLDDVIGIVLLKDLFSPFNNNEFNIKDYIKPPLFLNENIFAYKVLELFKKERIHYGIVIDEYGVTQGIVTMDDVVDALVGDVTELDQDEYQIVQRDDNSWLVDGQYPVIDFLKQFDIEIDDEIRSKFTTVAGMLIHTKSTLPAIGEKIVIENYTFEVVDKDGQRIDKILVTLHT